MKRMVAILLLLAAPAHAATFNFNFTKPYSYKVWPCDQIGTITNGGISATFGRVWSYAPDCDNNPSPCFCYNGYLVTDKAECPDGYHGICRPIYAGDFANEPSSGWAARVNCSFDCEPGDPTYPYCVTDADFGIRFDPPVRYFAISGTGTTIGTLWDCDGNVTLHEGTGSITTSTRIEMRDTLITTYVQPDHVEAQAFFPMEDGSVGCGGDPNGHLCNWWRIEVVSPVPVHRVQFVNASLSGPLFLDDVTAATGECPHPPCQFEAARQDRETPARCSTWGALKSIYR